MNKAIIICVLSLSLCLTQAAPPITDAHPEAAGPAEKKTNDVNIVNLPSETIEKSATVPKTDTKDIKTQEKADTKTEEAKDNKTENKAPSAVPEAQKSTEKPSEKSADVKSTEKPTDVKSTEKPTDVKPAEKTTDVKPAEKTTDVKPETTTQVVTKATEAGKDVTVKPTESPKDNVTEKPVETKRGFDGPSFIGGIILTLGLLAIGFMGLKYYKNQTERNYHTL